MNSTITRNDDNTVTVTVEYAGEPWKKAVKKTTNSAAASMKLDGFRKGKVPSAVVRKMFGAPALYEWAAGDVATDIFTEVLDENDIVPIEKPTFKIENAGSDSATLIYTIPVAPLAEIGDWKNLGVQKEEASVTDEQVNAVIDSLLDREAELVLVEDESPAAMGDTVEFKLEASSEGEPVNDLFTENQNLVLGSGNEEIPGLEEALVGARSEETRTFTLSYPEDAGDDLAGKSFDFTASIGDIYRRQKPELTDAFVAGLEDVDADSVDALTDLIRTNMTAEAENRAESAFETALMEALAATAKVEVPEAMVDEVIDQEISRVNRRFGEAGFTLETYLPMLGMSMDEYRDNMRESAEKTALENLALDALAREENIEISEQEAADYWKEMMGGNGDLKKDEVDISRLRQDMRRMKAMDALIQAHTPAAETEEVEIEAEDAQTE